MKDKKNEKITKNFSKMDSMERKVLKKLALFTF